MISTIPHLKDFAGCCDELVDALLGDGVVKGRRCEGVWTGPVAKRWGWRSDRWKRDEKGFPLHNWIETLDGRVVDPLRWVFEGVWPYIYEGPSDYYRATSITSAGVWT